MCTTIAMKSGGLYFGRNMDLEYNFGEQVVLMPRSFPLPFRRVGLVEKHYAVLGMATVRKGYPLYADGMNEKGLCIAGLSFPDNAYYFEEEADGKYNISPFELIPWVLGKCATVAEVRRLMAGSPLVNIPFDSQTPLSPLHWSISDRRESVVMESTREGLQLYDNPADVLTNNPPFPFQLTNLGQYLNLTIQQPQNCFSEKLGIHPFGLGLGCHGLPGDYSPASRFVKAAFLLQQSVAPADETANVSQLFHLLDSVAMPRGSVITQEKKWEITTYSACMNASQGIYYYKTYSNNALTAVDMRRENLDASELREFPLATTQQISWAN